MNRRNALLNIFKGAAFIAGGAALSLELARFPPSSGQPFKQQWVRLSEPEQSELKHHYVTLSIVSNTGEVLSPAKTIRVHTTVSKRS